MAIRLTFVRARTRGYNLRYMLIVGANAGASAFADAVARHRELGLQPIGHLAARMTGQIAPSSTVTRPILGDIADIEDILHTSIVDEVAICLTMEDLEVVEPIARLCEDEGRIVRIPVHQADRSYPEARSRSSTGSRSFPSSTAPIGRSA